MSSFTESGLKKHVEDSGWRVRPYDMTLIKVAAEYAATLETEPMSVEELDDALHAFKGLYDAIGSSEIRNLARHLQTALTIPQPRPVESVEATGFYLPLKVRNDLVHILHANNKSLMFDGEIMDLESLQPIHSSRPNSSTQALKAAESWMVEKGCSHEYPVMKDVRTSIARLESGGAEGGDIFRVIQDWFATDNKWPEDIVRMSTTQQKDLADFLARRLTAPKVVSREAIERAACLSALEILRDKLGMAEWASPQDAETILVYLIRHDLDTIKLAISILGGKR